MANTVHEQKQEDELRHLLEELRVAVPGVQILLAFLLMVPFNQRFTEVSDAGRVLFGIALAASCLTTILLLAPTVYHRVHFRLDVHDRGTRVRIFNTLALVGMSTMALGLTTGVAFVGDFVFGRPAALVGGAGCACLCVSLWCVLPLVRREKRRAERKQAHAQLGEASPHR